MIQANELRIGNWVYLPTAGENFEQQVRHVGLEGVNGFDLEESDPIPITEEVLLKCGFSEDEGPNWWAKDYFTDCNEAAEQMRISYNVTSRRCGVMDVDLGQPAMTGKIVEYLHQLQNLYFALTGQELAYTP